MLSYRKLGFLSADRILPSTYMTLKEKCWTDSPENFAPLSCALKTKTKPIAIKVTQRLFHKYTNVSQTFRALSLKSLQTTSNASTHILFLSLGLEPTNVVGCSVQILFKGDKNQGGVFD